MNKFDIIIIGGGIAGMYCAYQIKKITPDANICVLEKQSKKYMGGRTGNDNFTGTNVVTGAGIGRRKKDKLLVELLQEMNIKTTDFKVVRNYASSISPECSTKEIFLKIKAAYTKDTKPQTFREFAISVIGEKMYKRFVVCSSYSDYENENAYDTLFNYGFDDNYENWTGISIPWRELIETLVKKIDNNSVHFQKEVTKITNTTEGFKIKTTDSEYLCKKVVVATTIESLRKLIPTKNGIYKQIKGQPFLRTYGRFSKQCLEIMKKHVPSQTVVPGPLQKIIPMDPEKGVYMIAYSDNDSANFLNKYHENTEANRSRFCRILELSLGIEKNTLELLAIKNYYWKIGTHYYMPLSGEFKNRSEFVKIAQKPHKDIRVIGEMISENQGWVEGALESVKAVITEKWLKD